MVAPKPNATHLAGIVREVRPNERAPDYLDLVLAVESADDVEGVANLLADTPGQDLALTTDATAVAELGLQPGERVEVGAEVRGRGSVWSRPDTVRRSTAPGSQGE
jgi:hypothetical protein